MNGKDFCDLLSGHMRDAGRIPDIHGHKITERAPLWVHPTPSCRVVIEAEDADGWICGVSYSIGYAELLRRSADQITRLIRDRRDEALQSLKDGLADESPEPETATAQ